MGSEANAFPEPKIMIEKMTIIHTSFLIFSFIFINYIYLKNKKRGILFQGYFFYARVINQVTCSESFRLSGTPEVNALNANILPVSVGKASNRPAPLMVVGPADP